MKKILGTAVIASSLVGFYANAQTVEPYAGADVGFLDLGDASVTSLHLRGGAKFAENFAVEGRVGFGVGDDSVGPADVSLKHLYGIYFKAGLPVTEQFFPYAVLGYTKAKGESEWTVAGVDLSDSGSESDLSYGAGVDFQLNEAFTINAEYMNYVDKDGVELDGFTIGATLSF